MSNINLVMESEHSTTINSITNEHTINRYQKNKNIKKTTVSKNELTKIILPFFESLNFNNNIKNQEKNIKKNINIINKLGNNDDNLVYNIANILEILIYNQKFLFNRLSEINKKLLYHTNNNNIHMQKTHAQNSIIENNNKIIHSQNLIINDNNNSINTEDIYEIIENNSLKSMYKNLVINDILSNSNSNGSNNNNPNINKGIKIDATSDIDDESEHYSDDGENLKD